METPWYTVLGVSEDAAVEEVEAAASALLDEYSATKAGLTSLRLEQLADFGIDTSGCSDPAPIEEAYTRVDRAFRHYQSTNPAYLAAMREREAQRQAEELRQMPPYEPTHVRHKRLLQGGPWETANKLAPVCLPATEPGAVQRARAPVPSDYVPSWVHDPAPPFCDGRYRCLVCPGGLGYQGKGFDHRTQVPCTSYGDHMLVLRALAHDKVVCISEFDAHVLSDLFGAGASTKGIASDSCRFHVCSSTSEQMTDDHRPLARNIRCQPCPKRCRNRQSLLRWCTGLYHCPTCDVTATRQRRLNCTNPDAHVPKLHQNVPLDMVEVLHSGKVDGCEFCREVRELAT